MKNRMRDRHWVNRLNRKPVIHLQRKDEEKKRMFECTKE
jgi:hypothetical protein